MLNYSSESLVNGAKLRTMAPSNQFRFDDSEYLKLISDELITVITPLMLRVRESYFQKMRDFTILSTTVDGFGNDQFGLLPFGSPTPISTADLMERTIGLIVKDIWYIDTNGNVLGECPQLSFADIKSLDPVQGFYFQDSSIIFYPAQNFLNQKVRITYFRQPNRLVASSECAKVVFKNMTNSTVQVDVVPTGWGIGTKIDILRGKQGFDSILDSVMITGITGNELQLSSISDVITKGDYVVPEGGACVAQIPTNAYPLLEQRGAIKILESMKDESGVRLAEAEYQKMEALFMGVIANRAQNNLKKIVGRGIWR